MTSPGWIGASHTLTSYRFDALKADRSESHRALQYPCVDATSGAPIPRELILGQTEDALGDDVALDVGCAATDDDGRPV